MECNIQNIEQSGKRGQCCKYKDNREVHMSFHTCDIYTENGNAEQTEKYKKYWIWYYVGRHVFKGIYIDQKYYLQCNGNYSICEEHGVKS